MTPAALKPAPIEITTRPIYTAAVEPRGPISFVAGFELSSSDERLGGLSGLELSHDRTTLWAISDRGRWVAMPLIRGPRGELKGLGRCRIGPLVGTDGQPLRRDYNDAESLIAAGQGGFLVSFEHEHRLLSYPRGLAAPAAPFAGPPGLDAMPPNGGLEALVWLPQGKLMMLSERHRRADGAIAGWIGGGGQFESLGYRDRDGFAPTDMASVAGQVLVLERRYSHTEGVAARIMRLPAASAVAGAALRPELLVRIDGWLVADNFEGLAAEPRDDGSVLLYLISDDNFSERQQTLLYQLVWRPAHQQ